MESPVYQISIIGENERPARRHQEEEIVLIYQTGMIVVYKPVGHVDYVIELMRSGCRMQPGYTKRTEQFFAFRDNKNCEQKYNVIMELNEL